MTDTITHSLTPRADSGVMDSTTDPNPEVPAIVRPPRRFSASYKARIVAEYDLLDKQAKGALLRREGLYASVVSNWCRQSKRGAIAELSKSAGRQPTDPRDKEITRLRSRLAKVEGQLDKAQKVIEIQGKLSALLEQLATDNANNEGGETK